MGYTPGRIVGLVEVLVSLRRRIMSGDCRKKEWI
jgi:hypothetical protein